MKEWKDFEEEKAGARQKALVLLTDMDRSEQALREKLLRAGFSEAAACDALEYVKSFGYVDDRRYAAHYVDVMQTKRSRRRIEYDMVKKGLSRESIEAALEEAGPFDERPLVRELLEKKLRSMDKEDPKTRGKVAAFLMRQGFRGEDVRAVMEEYFLM